MSDIGRHGDSGAFESWICQRASWSSKGSGGVTLPNIPTADEQRSFCSCFLLWGWRLRSTERPRRGGSISSHLHFIPTSIYPTGFASNRGIPSRVCLSPDTLSAVHSGGHAPDLLARCLRRTGTLNKTIYHAPRSDWFLPLAYDQAAGQYKRHMCNVPGDIGSRVFTHHVQLGPVIGTRGPKPRKRVATFG
jgi:hypothetical protein